MVRSSDKRLCRVSATLVKYFKETLDTEIMYDFVFVYTVVLNSLCINVEQREIEAKFNVMVLHVHVFVF